MMILAKPQAKFISPVPLEHYRICCLVWERIVFAVFGPNALPLIDSFGRYIVLREQRIFRAFLRSDCFGNLFKAKMTKSKIK